MAKARTRTKARQKTQKKSAISPLVIAGVAIGALLIVVGLIYLGNQGQRVTGQVNISDFPALGKPDAPVTMIEFSDYG